MDNNIQKLLGLTQDGVTPDGEWLSGSIVKSINSYIIKGKWIKILINA